MKKESLEQDLFEWEDWETYAIMGIQFYDIILKKDIGKFKKGQKFKWACIDFDSSTLEIGGSLEKSTKFKLKLELK